MERDASRRGRAVTGQAASTLTSSAGPLQGLAADLQRAPGTGHFLEVGEEMAPENLADLDQTYRGSGVAQNGVLYFYFLRAPHALKHRVTDTSCALPGCRDSASLNM